MSIEIFEFLVCLPACNNPASNEDQFPKMNPRELIIYQKRECYYLKYYLIPLLKKRILLKREC